METANELLRSWRDINRQKIDRQSKAAFAIAQKPTHTPPPLPPVDAGANPLGLAIDKMKISGPPDRLAQDPRYYQQQQQPLPQIPSQHPGPLYPHQTSPRPPPTRQPTIPQGFPPQVATPARPPSRPYDQQLPPDPYSQPYPVS